MMSRARCKWCDGDAIEGTVCPKSIECPSCHAQPGARCTRPSGHVAQDLHSARVELAESMDVTPASGRTFTLYGAHSGQRFAGPVDLAGAVHWLAPYGHPETLRVVLAGLAVGEHYRTHADARGLVAMRLS